MAETQECFFLFSSFGVDGEKLETSSNRDVALEKQTQQL